MPKNLVIRDCDYKVYKRAISEKNVNSIIQGKNKQPKKSREFRNAIYVLLSEIKGINIFFLPAVPGMKTHESPCKKKSTLHCFKLLEIKTAGRA